MTATITTSPERKVRPAATAVSSLHSPQLHTRSATSAAFSAAFCSASCNISQLEVERQVMGAALLLLILVVAGLLLLLVMLLVIETRAV